MPKNDDWDDDSSPRKRRQVEMDLDEEFDGLDDATADERLPKLRAGRYSGLRIDKCLYKKGYKGKSFIMEFTLMGWSTNQHAEGDQVSTTINGFDKSDRRDLAMGNLKGFLAAALGADPRKKADWDVIAKKAVVNNALAGKLVDCTCEDTETRAGHDYLRVTFAKHNPDAVEPPKRSRSSMGKQDMDDDVPPRGASAKRKRAAEPDEDDSEI